MIESEKQNYKKYQRWANDILLEMNQPDMGAWNKNMYRKALEDISKICKHETGKEPKLD